MKKQVLAFLRTESIGSEPSAVKRTVGCNMVGEGITSACAVRKSSERSPSAARIGRCGVTKDATKAAQEINIIEAQTMAARRVRMDDMLRAWGAIDGRAATRDEESIAKMGGMSSEDCLEWIGVFQLSCV